MLKIGANKTHLCANQEVLTTKSHGDIDQISLKYGQVTLDTDFCMIILVKSQYYALCKVMH